MEVIFSKNKNNPINFVFFSFLAKSQTISLEKVDLLH